MYQKNWYRIRTGCYQIVSRQIKKPTVSSRAFFHFTTVTAGGGASARAALNMSQVAFAAAIGVTNVAVAQWETDKRTSPGYLRLAVAALIAGLEPWGT
ncbi:helix-turn-helix domain-containing protein [Asticcacaulis sp.]|uniref:helix-turn-helix domain-containing protein n=1 Tax=Asticcacaulis sp. TaxID=1872648 RepID=UPI003F7C9B7D